MKNNIGKLGCFLVALLIVLIFYLSYVQLETGPRLAAHPKNQRVLEQISITQRGNIYDRNRIPLAETRWVDNHRQRFYPFKNETCHLVGYTSKIYGITGLEAAYSKQLLGLTAAGRFINLVRKIQGKPPAGEDLVLTLDIKLQHLAAELLAETNKPGALVVLDPRTGAVLAAVSQPSFDPNNLEEQWKALINNRDAPLLNRAFQGAYPPGSVMKLITAAGALSAGYTGEEMFHCPGYLMVDGYKLADNGVHGNINIIEAIVVSCNKVFGKLGLDLGKKNFMQTAEKFGFKQDFNLSLEVRPSTISSDRDMDEKELASAAIGQGELLVSPLHMALVSATIANDGVMMQPYLVQEVISPSGQVLYHHKPSVMQRAASSTVCAAIRKAMIASVERGTGKAARIKNVAVAGKTGTAENEHGQPHAWFVAFAPAHQPRVAVAVIIENGGSGGAVAAPIAKRVIIEALR
ncbi:peptidoglycan glycosyltransferase [Desulfohalotomaculum tongense]|uniref:peptidoglycan D,D-transpeptidase FtsI family protein n=1 Tax=Desulforadius tongensis TaxID=1216062 RepID=UPI00195BC87F|nr:penicillin-binding transpeptidase domain-containing protein [Desulforadius tongensis]MBM7855748.1 peptidoglycan glycosyltransferase [Desulforadius tongensis]